MAEPAQCPVAGLVSGAVAAVPVLRSADVLLREVALLVGSGGVLRHADAGYDEAIDVAKARGVKIPGITL